MRPELLRTQCCSCFDTLGHSWNRSGPAVAGRGATAETTAGKGAAELRRARWARREPSSHAPSAKPAENSVFVNGALAVPGAPANTDTVPAKFSEKNAADDELITLAYTFKLLSDEQRRAICGGLKGQPAGPAFNADVGVELPSLIDCVPSRTIRCPRHANQGLSLRGSGQSRPAGVSGGPVRRGLLKGRRPSTQSGRRTPHALALPVWRMAHAYTQRNRSRSAPRGYVQVGSRTIASAASAWPAWRGRRSNTNARLSIPVRAARESR